LKRKFINSIEGKETMKQISTGLVSVVLLLNALGCSNGKVRAAAPPPPPVVEVAPVIQKDVPVQGEWVAQDSEKGGTIKPIIRLSPA
jgi:hypothetical protein